MTDLQSLIKDLREAEKRATEGPWEDLYELGDFDFKGPANLRSSDEGVMVSNWIQHGEDASLIVLLRNNVTRLLDAAEAGMRLREHIKEIGDDEYGARHYHGCADYDSAVGGGKGKV